MSKFAREHTGDPVADRTQEHIRRLERDAERNPFLSGALVRDVPLRGIRGRVAAISGTTLTLCDPATAANFTTYQAGVPKHGATIVASASDGTSGSQRSGSVNVASANVRTGEVESASGNWTTAISGLSVGDYLFGVNEWGPPVPVYSGGRRSGRYSSGPVTTLRTEGAGVRTPKGVFVVRAAVQPAVVWWLASPEPGVVVVGSRYAGIADLWVF